MLEKSFMKLTPVDIVSKLFFSLLLSQKYNMLDFLSLASLPASSNTYG